MVKLLHYYIFLRTSDLIYLQNFYIFLNSKWYYGEGRGGGGFRPIILETLNLRYGLKRKARIF